MEPRLKPVSFCAP